MKTAPSAVILALAALAVSACGTPGAPPSTPSPAEQPAVVETMPAPPPDPPPPAAPPAPVWTKTESPRNYETVRLKVTGMTCPIRCPREVKEQLLAVPGVLHVVIDTDDRAAIVDVVPGTNPELVLGGLKAPYAGRLM